MPDSKSEPKDCEFICKWQCGICVSVCKENAVSHGSELFIIERTACSGCLLCVRACPAGIIGEDLFA